jgi:hypothetical protein
MRSCPPFTPWPACPRPRPRPRRYTLPEASAQLSPLIYAMPGDVIGGQRPSPGAAAKPAAADAANAADQVTEGPGPGAAATPAAARAAKPAAVQAANQDWLIDFLSPKIAKIADSTGTLFTDDPAKGRPFERPAFMGFVAVAEGKEGEGADVALAWRGTVFLEEWQRNFQDDRLARPRAPHPAPVLEGAAASAPAPRSPPAPQSRSPPQCLSRLSR